MDIIGAVPGIFGPVFGGGHKKRKDRFVPPPVDTELEAINRQFQAVLGRGIGVQQEVDFWRNYFRTQGGEQGVRFGLMAGPEFKGLQQGQSPGQVDLSLVPGSGVYKPPSPSDVKPKDTPADTGRLTQFIPVPQMVPMPVESAGFSLSSPMGMIVVGVSVLLIFFMMKKRR